jgi:hypothetical protein
LKAAFWILFTLLLSSPWAYAQEDEPGDAEPVAEESTPAAEEAAPADEPAEAEVTSTEPETAQDPFDYRASEQISEDLSVSFPVDI